MSARLSVVSVRPELSSAPTICPDAASCAPPATLTFDTIVLLRQLALPPSVSASTSMVPFTATRFEPALLVSEFATTTPPRRSSVPLSAIGASGLKTASVASVIAPLSATGEPSFCARIDPPSDTMVLPSKLSVVPLAMVMPALVGMFVVPLNAIDSAAEMRAPFANSVVDAAPRAMALVERSSIDLPR